MLTLNVVLQKRGWTGSETSRRDNLRRRLLRKFPALRPVERTRFVMSAPLAEMVLSERKCTTIRYDPNMVEYPAAAVLPLFVVDPGKNHDEAVRRGSLRILSVNYKPVMELNDDDAKKDGFATRQSLIDTLERFYGTLSSADLVSIYTFELAEHEGSSKIEAPTIRTPAA